jgi:hypothetical protein
MACARHVATLAVTKAIGLAAVVLALALDALSHYWADRRSTLAWLADWLDRTVSPGKADFFRLGGPRPGRDDAPHLGTGAYALDQSWHIGFVFLAALTASVGAG